MLGSALIDSCQRHGIEAVGTSRLQADITNQDALAACARAICPTHIVNCAAYTDVDGAEKDPQTAFAINAEGAANVARTARDFGARLIHLSTDYVFSGTGSQPYKEDDPCAPPNTYGRSKWEGEKKVLEILKEACIIRTSWIFGPKGKNFISSLLKAFQQKEELRAVSDQAGRPTYVRDLAEAVLSMLNAEGIFHFANTGEKSRYQIALDVLEASKRLGLPHICQRIVSVSSAEFPTIAIRPAYSVLDTDKYFHHTNQKPRPWGEVVNEFLHHESSF
jgi:dTDP-4-dehydrorhamnose reductase